jgi:hypothetical protein
MSWLLQAVDQQQNPDMQEGVNFGSLLKSFLSNITFFFGHSATTYTAYNNWCQHIHKQWDVPAGWMSSFSGVLYHAPVEMKGLVRHQAFTGPACLCEDLLVILATTSVLSNTGGGIPNAGLCNQQRRDPVSLTSSVETRQP